MKQPIEFPTENDLFLLPEIKISFDIKVKPAQRYKITNSQDSYELFKKQYNPDTFYLLEECHVMYLNRSNRVLGICNISSGGISGCILDPRTVLATALVCGATAIILSHNHPSGHPKPSLADQQITTKILQASKLHDINLLDHIILADDSYYSFADEGLL